MTTRNRNRLFLGLALFVAAVAFYFHESPLLLLAGTVELGIIGVVVLTFVGVYSRRNWRSNPYGRALMYCNISLAIVIVLSLLTNLMGLDWEWRAMVRFLFFAGVLVAYSRLLQLLFSTRRSVAPKKVEEDRSDIRKV